MWSCAKCLVACMHNSCIVVLLKYCRWSKYASLKMNACLRWKVPPGEKYLCWCKLRKPLLGIEEKVPLQLSLPPKLDAKVPSTTLILHQVLLAMTKVSDKWPTPPWVVCEPLLSLLCSYHVDSLVRQQQEQFYLIYSKRSCISARFSPSDLMSNTEKEYSHPNFLVNWQMNRKSHFPYCVFWFTTKTVQI